MLVVYHPGSEQFLKIRWDETLWVDNINEANRFSDITEISASILADFKHDWYSLVCEVIPVKIVNNVIVDISYNMSFPVHDIL